MENELSENKVNFETQSKRTDSPDGMKTGTSKTSYECDICKKIFSQKGNLIRHNRIHTGAKPHHCDICGKSFSRYEHVTTHKRIHTGDKPYQCDICGKSFSRHEHVTTHKRIHTGETPYQCDICAKSFSYGNTLATHKRIHTGEKPYHCEICGKSFCEKSVLTIHGRIHTGEKPYHCDTCGKSFSQSSGLITHKRIHTGEKPHHCDTCGKSFSASSDLMFHRCFHTGEKSYSHVGIQTEKFTMEDQTENTLRKLIPQKRALSYSTPKWDEEGADNKRCKYERDDGSRREISEKRASSQPTTKQKRHKGDPKNREIMGRRDVFDKHIFYTRFNAYEKKIDLLINSREKICTFLKRIGMDENTFLKHFTQRIEILTKDIKKKDYNQEFIIFGKLELFLEHYLKTNVLQDKHKTIEAPKIITKFRPLQSVVTREADIEESGEEFEEIPIISNIIIIEEGVMTYSHHYKIINLVTRDSDRIDVHCPSSVTSFTRISEDMVLATLPFQEMILIISPKTFKIKRIQLGLHMVSYLEDSTLIGVEMFGKTVYQFDWEDNTINYQFITKETPTDIAVGVQNILVITFASINRVICYKLDGQQLWEVETHSLHLPSKISLYQNCFYVLQGQIIYRISAKGGVTRRDIGRKCRSISVGKDTILVTDYCGKPHGIQMNKDFWPKLSYNHQLHTPSLKDYIYIEDCYNITNILPMSTSSILIIYKNKKAKLFTDNGEIINQNNSVFLELPSFCCRINANRFLVFYPEMKGFQYITCPELRRGPLIKVQTGYMKICHIVSNKCLAVTTTENKSEVHILLINKDKVDIAERISLGHHNVSIAATPINFVVVDGSENKMVFYSTCGEELFQKYLPFYGHPHHIYSDNVYFYVLFRRHSILRCYDLYGEMKWQWELPFPVHPHIAVFQGTLYVPDTQLNRVLLYKYQDRSSACLLPIKNPYIRNLNLRLKEKENDQKLVIGEICNLSNGQLVVSDINHDCLLYISEEGDIVSRLSLPSTATDICRWDSNHIGVTLPLQKQLRVIGNQSKTVRSISFRQPYVRMCKMGECEIVCYCDKPSQLDILAINYYNQVEVIKTINISVFVKSLSIDKKTEKLLIVTRGKAFQYNTRIGGGGRGGRQMVPSVLMSQVKRPLSLQGGSIDQTSVYLIDRSRMFAINDQNLLVNDLVTNNQLNYYIDLVDVFARHISLSEMLSSTLYLQDLTVSDKARRIPLPEHLGDKEPVEIYRLVLTENNLIAGWDRANGNIKIFTLDGHLMDSIKVNLYEYIKMCRWQSNTLVITGRDLYKKPQLLTLKVEFPLSLVIYKTRNKYYGCVASLSNNQLVLSEEGDRRHLHFVDIDERHSSVKEIKKIDIPEPLIEREDGKYSGRIRDIKVTDEDVIIVFNMRFIIFFNSGGQYLHSVRHYMNCNLDDIDRMTIDDSFLYVHGEWEKYFGYPKYGNILCLTQNGEYKRIFLNERIYKDKVYFSSIDCKGPRFVGCPKWRENELYVEGLFMVNRDSFPVARLQTDECPVQVKDFDVSEEGKTVVCEKANNGNVKIFDEDGQLLRHRNVASLVGGVCFTQESHIMATVPKRKEIFHLNGEDLQTSQVWSSLIPYGVIWRKVAGIYWCVHNELIECHCIKIDGDQVNILESVSLLNLDSGLRFPSITSETNKEIFSNELINKLEYRGGDGDGGGRRRGKSGEIIGKGGLKVRCGNYIAEINNSGIDEISVRRLPYRTAMVPFSIPAFEEPVDYDRRDWNSNLIKLDENVSVLMFRESVTLIRTTTTVDILQHEQQQRTPLDICRWTEECFIVAFGREMRVFNRDLRRLRTIRTEKYYNRIYKYNDNQLVCGGHYIRDITQKERHKKYKRIWINNKDYYFCNDPDIFDPYYVDVVDIKDGKCKDEVCRGKMRRFGRLEGDEGVLDGVGVTSFGDVVVVRKEMEKERWPERWDVLCFVEWFREKSLVRRIRIKEAVFVMEYYIPRPRLTIIGECVYITDFRNNIYEIPRHIEEETSEDIKIRGLEDNPKYLLLRGEDNEVSEVLGLDVSDNSLMVFGIIPGRQSFAFFYFDK
ncbi:XP_014783180.1PREDICTED: uncharacterized protein LOC106878473 [Octopus vulgaris]|uniref:XP_014783180.1PREDICTED: uncharacterized protein LOC106878473 n=1 Tax=Octopus vulgaris TaxID=6645 RepID=A0AA36BZC1_OCTVU|nr:XP_014783180.1PREDICTED: uncharacterized protein LOC106878473 [Octopus vulgaris]